MSRQFVILGASSGIGAELAAKLEEDGDRILRVGRSLEPPVDVTDPDPPFPEPADALDGLVYCPGSIQLKPFGSLDPDEFRKDLELNLVGAVKCVQFYLPALKRADSASIVLFSTVAVQTGMPFHTSVAAAKGAVEGFARALAAELAPRIRVNVVAPSLTDTPLAARLLRTEKQRETGAGRHPLRRIGTPSDIASAARFLLGPESSWVTGQVLAVDGGLGSLRTL